MSYPPLSCNSGSNEIHSWVSFHLKYRHSPILCDQLIESVAEYFSINGVNWNENEIDILLPDIVEIYKSYDLQNLAQSHLLLLLRTKNIVLNNNKNNVNGFSNVTQQELFKNRPLVMNMFASQYSNPKYEFHLFYSQLKDIYLNFMVDDWKKNNNKLLVSGGIVFSNDSDYGTPRSLECDPLPEVITEKNAPFFAPCHRYVELKKSVNHGPGSLGYKKEIHDLTDCIWFHVSLTWGMNLKARAKFRLTFDLGRPDNIRDLVPQKWLNRDLTALEALYAIFDIKQRSGCPVDPSIQEWMMKDPLDCFWFTQDIQKYNFWISLGLIIPRCMDLSYNPEPTFSFNPIHTPMNNTSTKHIFHGTKNKQIDDTDSNNNNSTVKKIKIEKN